MDYEEHLQASSPTIVFAFATCVNDTFGDIPRYEFGNLLRSLGVAFVLFRSPREEWYQKGIDGLGNVPHVASYMWEIGTRYKRSIALGTSSGSYGALLFGELAPTQETIAISPVTGMGEDCWGDFEPEWYHRFPHDHNKLRVRDLKDVFKNGARGRVRLFVTNGDAAELDLGMAQRIGVGEITTIPGHTHAGLARAMRDMGMLKDLLAC